MSPKNEPLTNLPPRRPYPGKRVRDRQCRLCEHRAAPDDAYCPYCRLLVDRERRADPRRVGAL